MLLKPSHNTAKLPECRWASLYLIIGLIKAFCFLRANLSLLPAQHWLQIAVYVTGLITQHNVSATAIAASVGLVSHDQLTRLLASLTWGLSEGALLAVRIVSLLGGQGYLIIDDVLIPKPFANKIALCFWDHDHSLNRHSFGQRLVFVVWSNGHLTIPLLFAFWQKGPVTARKKKQKRRTKRKPGRKKKPGRKVTDFSKAGKLRRARYRERRQLVKRRVRLANGLHYRSKNELARSLVWKLVRRGIRVEFILFDNWYASRENLAFFERLGLKWVTRCKENAKVYYQGERLSVKQVGASVKKANYHYYSALGARVRSYEVEYGDRLVRLTVIKDDTAREAGRTKYLMTNALKLTNQETVGWYRKRWTIEVFFRDAKQYLGLARSEARSEQAVISHVGLVCVAYVIVQLLKPVEAQPRPSIRVSKNALAALVVVVEADWQIVRQKPTGRFEEVSYEHLWHPIRTRFHDLACPEFIGDTGLLL